MWNAKVPYARLRVSNPNWKHKPIPEFLFNSVFIAPDPDDNIWLGRNIAHFISIRLQLDLKFQANYQQVKVFVNLFYIEGEERKRMSI